MSLNQVFHLLFRPAWFQWKKFCCFRKDFESTRTFAKGLDAVLIDQDRRLQLAVKQDMCQRVLAFAQGLGSDQTPAFHAL